MSTPNFNCFSLQLLDLVLGQLDAWRRGHELVEEGVGAEVSRVHQLHVVGQERVVEKAVVKNVGKLLED